jgi:type II secretory pathway pseudopilin PulG
MDTEAARSKSLELILGLLILLGVVATALIRIDVRRGEAHRQEASSNARSFSLALLEFESDYGFYPNDTTAALVTATYPAHGHDLKGNSSNAAFRQLIAAGFTQSEWTSYARIPGTIKPDGNIRPGEAMKKREVGFSYISGLSSKDDPLTPMVLTPLIPGTTKFDPKPFNGKAVILHIDNSVRTYDMHKDGHVYDNKGINLLSPKHPIWKGKTPDIRYPEL